MTIFFASESVLKGGEVSRNVRGRMFDESASAAIQTLYENKLENFDKTYMELILDAHLQSESGSNVYGSNETHVYYGRGLSTIYVPEVINSLFNKYFGKGGWKLVVKTREGSVTYGNLKKESKYKYISSIPVPPSLSKNNVGNVTLYV